jgi:hypothetical protein
MSAASPVHLMLLDLITPIAFDEEKVIFQDHYFGGCYTNISEMEAKFLKSVHLFGGSCEN